MGFSAVSSCSVIPSTVNIKPFNVPVFDTELSSEVTQGGIYGFLFKYSNTKTIIVG